MNQPNIIYIFSDQQRWDTCGCYGQPLDVTPNLDRMAADGVRFEHAYTCQPVCGPARACIQTGKFATEVGCETNNCRLPDEEKTIANHMSEAGYEVGYIGKWHLASSGPEDGPDDFRTKPVPPERRGGYVDHWLASDVLEFTSHSYDGHMFDASGNKREFPEGRYRVDAQTDWVIEYLNSRMSPTGEQASLRPRAAGGGIQAPAGQAGREPSEPQKPLFLFVSYIEPHHQNDHKHFEGPHGSKEKYKDFTVPGDLVDTEGDWRAEYPDYLGCINSLDQNVGRIRDELDKLGMTDNTVLIYTSDHGSHFCTRNSEYKRSCHDGCIRIPMIINGPGFKGGKVVEELVSLLDTPPTVLAAGDVDVPDYMGGRALQDIASLPACWQEAEFAPLPGEPAGSGEKTATADQTSAKWPEEVFLQISENQCGRAIRTKKWKYSVRAPSEGRVDTIASEVFVEDFLYDLEVDPHERNNLVTDQAFADVRAELAETLKRRMVEAGEKEPEIQDNRTVGQ